MKITKIYFESLYPTGSFANQRYGADVTIEEGENIIDAYKFAKDNADAAFKKLNPELAPSLTDFNSGQQQAPPVIDRAKETLKEIINDCETVEELLKHKDDVVKYGLIGFYIEKLNRLQPLQK